MDRIASIQFNKIRKYFANESKVQIPILMYHSISNENEYNIHPYYRLNTSPKMFKEHMNYLKLNNYSVINLTEANEYVKRQIQKNKRYVVITFDDGYKDFYTDAFPILNSYGYIAHVYLPTAFIGSRFHNKECLNWDEVLELGKYGNQFGSHTVSHPDLIKLKKDEIISEILESKKEIESKTGRIIDSFAYPYAFPSERKKFIGFLGESLKKYGYSNCVTTQVGTIKDNKKHFFLKRIPVNSFDDLMFFQAKLEGSYNWINLLQFTSRQFKHEFAKLYREQNNKN